MLSHALQILVLSLFSLSSVSARAIPVAAPTKVATKCNGYPELCDRPYSNVTYIGSHDSFAHSKLPIALSRNQEVDVTTQLSMGVRLLQAQGRMWGKDLNFCHTNCILFNGGKVVDYLKNVKKWLDKNPNEVLTLIVTNPEKKPVTLWKQAFDQAGMSKMAYVPPEVPMKHEDWPTLGEMIESGKRIVVFLDKGADTKTANFILPQFQMIWETPHGMTDDKFPCSVHRTAGPLSRADQMYMINHSVNLNILGLIIPDGSRSKKTNSVKSIVSHANNCARITDPKRNPTFVLLDWVHDGQPFKAAKILNGLA